MSEKDHGQDSGGFSLSGGNAGFSAKSNDIFAGLEALERKHETVLKEQAKEPKVTGLIKDDPKPGDFSSDNLTGNKGSNKPWTPTGCSLKQDDQTDKRSTTSSFQGVFRKPQGLPPGRRGGGRGRGVADHQRHPERYTHYTLSDVPDMTDGANTAAAMAFLRQRKTEEIHEMDEGEESGKIVFRKPVAKESDTEEKKGISGSGKVIMPEYVVGQKVNKTIKSKPTQANVINDSSDKNISLSHLDDEQDDNDGMSNSTNTTVFKKKSKKAGIRGRDTDNCAMDEQVNKGTKRNNDDDNNDKSNDRQEEGGQVIVRIDRAAERRKKARGKRFVRQQIPTEDDSDENEEEEWQEELERARKEEEEEEKKRDGGDGNNANEEGVQVEMKDNEDNVDDMIVEGIE